MERHSERPGQSRPGHARRSPLCALVVTCALAAGLPLTVAAEPFVELQTSQGAIVLELHPEAAPQTVANFLEYVDEGFYGGSVMHRIIPGFMVQGGGYDQQLRSLRPHDPIENEAARCHRNRRGTVAMARSMVPRSTTSQFFINLTDNPHLDHVRPEPGYEGYCAFATVVRGMDVADRMARVATGPGGVFMADVPLQPVVIHEAQRVNGPFNLLSTAPEPAADQEVTNGSPKRAARSTMARRNTNRRGSP